MADKIATVQDVIDAYAWNTDLPSNKCVTVAELQALNVIASIISNPACSKEIKTAGCIINVINLLTYDINVTFSYEHGAVYPTISPGKYYTFDYATEGVVTSMFYLHFGTPRTVLHQYTQFQAAYSKQMYWCTLHTSIKDLEYPQSSSYRTSVTAIVLPS